VLCYPVLSPDRSTLGTDLIKGGSLRIERLVNMQKTAIHNAQNYRLEPNPMFTPDQKYIVFPLEHLRPGLRLRRGGREGCALILRPLMATPKSILWLLAAAVALPFAARAQDGLRPEHRGQPRPLVRPG